MEFKCNGTEWTIEEISNAEMQEKYELEKAFTHGITLYNENIIYINKETKSKIRTLKHELTHVWLWEYGHNQGEKEFNCEDVCEIVACSNDFINEVIDKYKNKDIIFPKIDLERIKRQPVQLLSY